MVKDEVVNFVALKIADHCASRSGTEDWKTLAKFVRGELEKLLEMDRATKFSSDVERRSQ